MACPAGDPPSGVACSGEPRERARAIRTAARAAAACRARFACRGPRGAQQPAFPGLAGRVRRRTGDRQTDRRGGSSARNRYQQEATALRLAGRARPPVVPELLAADPDTRVLVLEYLTGQERVDGWMTAW